MSSNTLRAVWKARPFHPFRICTGSGESYSISHPELIVVAKEGDIAVILLGKGQVGLIDIPSITEIVTSPSARTIGPDDDEPDLTA